MFSAVEDLLREASEGRMFILQDDEDREDEGDIMMAAQFITPESINFMLRYVRGVVCVPVHCKIAERLQLELQNRRNVDDSTVPAFTMSVGARKGVTTGVSAHDRAHTIRVIADEHSTIDDIQTPGHVFPLIAHKDGLRGRRGHTEAAVEVMQMSGLVPAAVLCEILNDDGSVASRDCVAAFAKKHGIKVATVDSVAGYSRSVSK